MTRLECMEAVNEARDMIANATDTASAEREQADLLGAIARALVVLAATALEREE